MFAGTAYNEQQRVDELFRLVMREMWQMCSTAWLKSTSGIAGYWLLYSSSLLLSTLTNCFGWSQFCGLNANSPLPTTWLIKEVKMLHGNSPFSSGVP